MARITPRLSDKMAKQMDIEEEEDSEDPDKVQDEDPIKEDTK